ncbi:MAG: hypothetical protein ACI9EW_004098 [Cellvibrionaceae bacterium]|jgi:hypothetical protein
MNRSNWWKNLDPKLVEPLGQVWIPVGLPGFSGDAKANRTAMLDQKYGAGGWEMRHYVRGKIVPKAVAIFEYEEAYRQFLHSQPAMVEFLVTACGNVYDYAPDNVFDDDYEQPHTPMNHYQDISVRRVINELASDPDWPTVTPTPAETVWLTDLTDGERHHFPRANGFRGDYLLQIREPDSPGFLLNPAVVPCHDPALINTLPSKNEWYHAEGCAHLSIEAFWQMSKVLVVRYDRFLGTGESRTRPLSQS